jgi:hypothetical protein
MPLPIFHSLLFKISPQRLSRWYKPSCLNPDVYIHKISSQWSSILLRQARLSTLLTYFGPTGWLNKQILEQKRPRATVDASYGALCLGLMRLATFKSNMNILFEARPQFETATSSFEMIVIADNLSSRNIPMLEACLKSEDEKQNAYLRRRQFPR